MFPCDSFFASCIPVFTESGILACGDVVTPAEILIEKGNLLKNNYEAWRKGQVTYLERVIEGNLSKINRIII